MGNAEYMGGGNQTLKNFFVLVLIPM